MQENEKYGIELEAKTNLFKKGLQEAIKYTKAFGQGVKESFNEQVSKSMKSMSDFFREDFNIFDKDYSKRIDYIKDEMDAVTDQINAIKEGGKEGNLSELEAEYDRLTKKLEFFTSKQSELNKELEETSDTSSKTSSSLHSLFDKSIGKIKRFTYYLLGARSVFSLFMRYRSAYYQFNEEMQYQSELSQNAIALSLGPAFEFLGNVIAYASIGLAKFIELLTGVNVLSKVTTKGIKNYNKSLKETQTLVSGIDEITNLTNPQNLGLADQYKALDDFRKKIEEVEKFFAENTWIQGLANGLKEVWKFIKETLLPIIKKLFDNVGGVEGALKLLGGVAVMTALGNLIGTSNGFGLLRIATLLGTIVGTHIIYLVLTGNEEYKRIMATRVYSSTKDYNTLLSQTEALKNKLKTINKNSTDYDEILKRIKNNWKLITDTITEGNPEILKNLDNVEKLAVELDDITDPYGQRLFGNTLTLSERLGIDVAKNDAKSFTDKLKDWFSGTDETIENVRKANLNTYNKLKENLTLLNELQTKIKQMPEKITIDMGIKFTFSKKQLQDLIDKTKYLSTHMLGMTESSFNAIANNVLKKFGYAKGLDYVPYDDYPALLHKGEAVVPAKYNPTIHSQGNEYTNSLLETLILKVDDLASRPNVFEIDGQQFANATYGLYDNERKRQGYVEGVVR